ncbi:MAG: N-formylglutamate amidohydrolase [Rhodospirillales bacterium]|nr:MAG: N-formylglutamate amidohydrolase [Rhodospirillales bacterium]
MATVTEAHDDEGPAWTALEPAEQTLPLVFASPHSGIRYPPSFIAASRLDPVTLRQSEDAFIDELFADVVSHGVPLLKANFPRAYVDPNREPYELDPAMFDTPLPAYVNISSPRVQAGLGTVARVVTSGEEIYRAKLSFAEVRQRIDRLYFPYHAALARLIDGTRERFGVCLLIDCHSMPSVGGPMDADPGLRRVDTVLGDRFGTSCAPAVTDAAEAALLQLGFSVCRNVPYAGGFTTKHYGQPRKRVHALQIELNRALYMDEKTITPTAGLAVVRAKMRGLIESFARLDLDVLRAA